MIRTLDDPYLAWLYKQVAVRSIKERDPSRTHWDLFRQLYSIEFVWIVDRDDNRAEDGRALRYEWDDSIDEHIPNWWFMRGCSFLEMLIGLSRHLAFEGDGEPHLWFWHLLDNIDLVRCNDRADVDPREIAEIVQTVIWRTYDRNGQGGLFPLKRPRRDQRKAELWFQMSDYLMSN